MTLNDLLRPEATTQRLTRGGLTAAAAARHTATFGRCAQVLAAGHLPHTNAVACFVPGRIEVLGKHTDYAGGSSLVCAVEHGFCLVACPRPDGVLHLTDLDGGETARFALTPDLQPRATHWSLYPMTVARRLARNFPGLQHGADIAFASDLPRAAGLSSSSAFMISVFMALAAVNRLARHHAYPDALHEPIALAQYLAAIEGGRAFGALAGNPGVGTAGGSQDHTAILCSRPGHLHHYHYRPNRLAAAIALPPGLAFVIASSGVVAEKTGAAQERYNQAAHLAAAAAEAWQYATGLHTPHLGAALSSPGCTPEALHAALRNAATPDQTAAVLIARAEHFRAEIRCVTGAVDALHAGDLKRFGRHVAQSQQAAERLLMNQIPETAFLARCARSLGAHAASAFGAGFGGAVWALVDETRTAAFLERWSRQYQAAFPGTARQGAFFTARPGPAAFRLTEPDEAPA